jgi:hypothetical protein
LPPARSRTPRSSSSAASARGPGLWSIVAQFSILNAVFVGAYAYGALGSICLVPVGLALIGPVADAIRTEATLYAAAALVIAATLPVFTVRDVRELRRK